MLAKHCFASARTHSRQRLGRTAERDLRRPPQPDPPRRRAGNQLLLLLRLLLWPWPLRVQGAALPRPPTLYLPP
ncbi:hypothetical protein B9Y64_09665 [Stenotrophomonas maltophilia]|uniref:Uncharacterized protein n=1 Tax=Stenotrophomonas maltophilia TaxID=40324 RepID=A0A2J0UEF4_STEMA|nr:hypothetical protein B9Y64_09665 [Stenotrophomonas maltophilia]